MENPKYNFDFPQVLDERRDTESLVDVHSAIPAAGGPLSIL